MILHKIDGRIVEHMGYKWVQWTCHPPLESVHKLIDGTGKDRGSVFKYDFSQNYRAYSIDGYGPKYFDNFLAACAELQKYIERRDKLGPNVNVIVPVYIKLDV